MDFHWTYKLPFRNHNTSHKHYVKVDNDMTLHVTMTINQLKISFKKKFLRFFLKKIIYLTIHLVNHKVGALIVVDVKQLSS